MRRRSWSACRMLLTVGVACVVVAAVLLLASQVRWWPRATGAVLGITSARVVRTGEYPENHIPAFEGTLSDAGTAYRLFEAVQALLPYPQGRYECGMSLGIAYHLTFYRGGEQVAWADAQPNLCGAVTLDDGDRRQANEQFWQLFTGAFGMSQYQLFPFPPTPGADGPPYAPTPTRR